MKVMRVLFIVLFCGAIIMIGYWAVFPGSSPEWTGFGPYDEKSMPPRSKTLWDWLALLLIPILLAIGAWLLSHVEKETEKKIESDRQKQTMLNTYFDQMTELLLTHKLRLSVQGSEVRDIARTKTLAIFRGLDQGRKTTVLQFLYESNLISKNPIICLNGARLNGADLDYAVLRKAEIRGAYFVNAMMKNSHLNDAYFMGCDFTGADLRGADLDGADLSYSQFVKAKLSNVDFSKANIVGVDFTGADLRGATITDKQRKEVAAIDDKKFFINLLFLKILKNKKWKRKNAIHVVERAR
jgi:uncharacterized protein YjbI with pentapeptide repeats